jgi:hypothetical protein
MNLFQRRALPARVWIMAAVVAGSLGTAACSGSTTTVDAGDSSAQQAAPAAGATAADESSSEAGGPWIVDSGTPATIRQTGADAPGAEAPTARTSDAGAALGERLRAAVASSDLARSLVGDAQADQTDQSFDDGLGLAYQLRDASLRLIAQPLQSPLPLDAIAPEESRPELTSVGDVQVVRLQTADVVQVLVVSHDGLMLNAVVQSTPGSDPAVAVDDLQRLALDLLARISER